MRTGDKAQAGVDNGDPSNIVLKEHDEALFTNGVLAAYGPRDFGRRQ